jgi:hypothetical protein
LITKIFVYLVLLKIFTVWVRPLLGCIFMNITRTNPKN